MTEIGGHMAQTRKSMTATSMPSASDNDDVTTVVTTAAVAVLSIPSSMTCILK